MGDKSGIEWTEATWNMIRGQKGRWWCSKIRPGCAHCYAETWAAFRGQGQAYRFGADALQLDERALEQPLRWRRPRLIFPCSMTDLFHPGVPDAWIERVFQVMEATPQHTYQVLTKHGFGRWWRDRSRVLDLAPRLPWPANVWMGGSIELNRFAWVADRLREVPAAVRWISAEPLLGPLPDLKLAGLHWLVAGGESGRDARPIEESWVRGLRDLCGSAGVAFFFKQWGGRNKRAAGRMLEGRQWSEYPRAIA